MPNINAFRQVVHEKKIFEDFCYKNLYNSMSLKGARTNLNLQLVRILHAKYKSIQAGGS